MTITEAGWLHIFTAATLGYIAVVATVCLILLATRKDTPQQQPEVEGDATVPVWQDQQPEAVLSAEQTETTSVLFDPVAQGWPSQATSVDLSAEQPTQVSQARRAAEGYRGEP